MRVHFIAIGGAAMHSLAKNFLTHYVGTMEEADDAVVFYNPETIKHKRLPMISKEEVMSAFKKKDLKVSPAGKSWRLTCSINTGKK